MSALQRYETEKALDRRYKSLAYSVLRDAVGFYFGIPKFLETKDATRPQAFETKLNSKIEAFRRQKGKEPQAHDLKRFTQSVDLALERRIEQLEEDFRFTEDVLFNPNLWLETLDLGKDFFKNLFSKMSKDTKAELAVIPTWTTSDYSLGRSYINDNVESRDFSDRADYSNQEF